MTPVRYYPAELSAFLFWLISDKLNKTVPPKADSILVTTAYDPEGTRTLNLRIDSPMFGAQVFCLQGVMMAFLAQKVGSK